MDQLQWTDVDDIGYALWQAEPTFDPLTIRFTDLIDRVLSLPGFQGERDRCNEKILEAIQMAWLEEFNEA
jgi:FeS assembly protein IscX